MWWESVNTGGDSPAAAQVSDNAGGFGRLASTAASPDRHEKLSRGQKFYQPAGSRRGARVVGVFIAA